MQLFYAIKPSEADRLMECIGGVTVHYKKDDYIIETGSDVTSFGIVIDGLCCSFKWDATGRRVIYSFVKGGGVIGVMVAAKDGHPSPVSVQAVEDSVILMVPFAKLITRCGKNCPSHEQLLRNYIGVVAEKGLELYERLDCLLSPTIREKVFTYLTRLSREQDSKTFLVPMDRNGMAEYLNIERSALSRALSQMKKEGLIDYRKNYFKLL